MSKSTETKHSSTAAERPRKYRANLARRPEDAVVAAFADGYDKGFLAGLSEGMRRKST